MDEVAAAAGVSKQTVYKHFSDKQGLFTEIVLGTIDEVGDPFWEDIENLAESADAGDALRDAARQLVGIVENPRLLQLRRLVSAEAERFPELGRSYYERGPGRTIAALAEAFERLAERGKLLVPDATLAAEHFNWLVVSIPINRAMFDPDASFSRAELDAYADEAVRIFLAAYS